MQRLTECCMTRFVPVLMSETVFGDHAYALAELLALQSASQPASQPLSMYIKYSAGKERQNVAKHYLAICCNKSISRRDLGNIGAF